MTVLKNLQPQLVWQYFEEICKIPRPSKKEEKMIQFLLDFGQKHQLETKRDKIGNVLIKKPATKGKENLKTVVLQSHIDMVCEKNADKQHNFEVDPITPIIDGDWVRADGTTLGADDGIGIAASMAVLTDTELIHGPIECLFTVDEETGLSGAFALEPDFITGKILVNLDSEDEGQLFIGCAGGKDTVVKLRYEHRRPSRKSIAYKISLSGLKGGHSGDDIHKGRGNSIKILNRFLWQATEKFKIRLHCFEGGNLRNAIPREASAVVLINKQNIQQFVDYFNQFCREIKYEFAITEPLLTLTCEETEKPEFVLNKKAHFNLLYSLYACPHGVIAMSQRMPGMVETSTNLASVKFRDKKIIEITTSQRSDNNTSKEDIAAMVGCVFKLVDAKVIHSDGYPGWTPNPESEIVDITVAAYKKLFKTEPKVRSIHAGLECGLFLEKYPTLDMVSFGPTLQGVHSPDEKIEIQTVQKFWNLIVEVLKNIPKEK